MLIASALESKAKAPATNIPEGKVNASMDHAKMTPASLFGPGAQVRTTNQRTALHANNQTMNVALKNRADSGAILRRRRVLVTMTPNLISESRLQT